MASSQCTDVWIIEQTVEADRKVICCLTSRQPHATNVFALCIRGCKMADSIVYCIRTFQACKQVKMYMVQPLRRCSCFLKLYLLFGKVPLKHLHVGAVCVWLVYSCAVHLLCTSRSVAAIGVTMGTVVHMQCGPALTTVLIPLDDPTSAVFCAHVLACVCSFCSCPW